MSTDRPTETDLLGFEPYVVGIERLVRDFSGDYAFTLGIYGPWGSGKTSFMMQLRKRLMGNQGDGSPLPVIWFDAWKYDRKEDVRDALVYKVLTELLAQSQSDEKGEVAKKVKECLSFLGKIIKSSHVTIGGPGLSVELTPGSALDEPVDRLKEFHTGVDKLSEAFSDAVKEFLGELNPDVHKLIIFIDDLDRCLPENVLATLEALKLFLDTAPCVFIMGIDRIVVERAIQSHYGTDPAVSGREYLDKIIQLSLTIPLAQPDALAKLFGQLGGDVGLDENDRYIFELAAGGNPRLYARLLAAWRVVSSLAPNFGFNMADVQDKRLLMIATAVHVRFPGLHAVTRADPVHFPFFRSMCLEPNKAQGGELFVSNQAGSFKEYWQDPAVVDFFYRLSLRFQGALDLSLISMPPKIRGAFNLSQVI